MKKFLLFSFALFFFCQHSYAQFPDSKKVYCFKPSYEVTSSGEKRPPTTGDYSRRTWYFMFRENCMCYICSYYDKDCQKYSDDNNYFYRELSNKCSVAIDHLNDGNNQIENNIFYSRSHACDHYYYNPDFSSSKQTVYVQRYLRKENGAIFWEWVNKRRRYYFKNDLSMFVYEYEGIKYYYEQFDINTLNLGHNSYEMF